MNWDLFKHMLWLSSSIFCTIVITLCLAQWYVLSKQHRGMGKWIIISLVVLFGNCALDVLNTYILFHQPRQTTFAFTYRCW